MNEIGYTSACEHLSLAEKHMQSLHDPDISPEDSKVIWRYFLEESSLVYNKLSASCKIGPSKGWYDRHQHLRSADQLLSYLMHARNAATHGIDVISHLKRSPKISIRIPGAVWGPPTGQNQRNKTYYDEKGNAVLETHAIWIVCNTVTDRNKTYAPPNFHLGQEVVDSTVWTIGNLSLSFQRTMLNEARGFLRGNKS